VPAGVQVTVAESPRMKVTGRLNDTAPFWGGGRIQNNDNNAFCSAGWPVTVGGANYMLTAGHCGRPGGGWNNGNDSVFFGTGALENVDHDVLLISASVGGRMWDGGVGSGEFTKGVAGSDNAFPGEFLCTSASVSGAVCNFRTSDSFQFSFCDDDAYGNFECYSDLVLADQLDGQPGARPGDSGGPVFSLSGTDRVIAKGTITGSGGSTLAFQDFVTAQRDLGISVITG
jgi:streptogrisin D